MIEYLHQFLSQFSLVSPLISILLNHSYTATVTFNWTLDSVDWQYYSNPQLTDRLAWVRMEIYRNTEQTSNRKARAWIENWASSSGVPSWLVGIEEETPGIVDLGISGNVATFTIPVMTSFDFYIWIRIQSSWRDTVVSSNSVVKLYDNGILIDSESISITETGQGSPPFGSSTTREPWLIIVTEPPPTVLNEVNP